MSNNTESYEFDWDSTIENESPDFILLPDGDYDFEVTEFERARHTGSEKLPPCNKAIIHIKIVTDEGMNIIRHNFFLHSITEGILCAFFTAIGQRQKGEKFKMDWGAVVGATGRCKVGTRKWKADNGEERTSNEIKRFYEPAEKAPVQQQGFEPGKF